GAELHWLTPDSLDRLMSLVVDADLRASVDGWRPAERRHWIGGSRENDGVPHSALGPRSATYPTVVRDLAATPRDHGRPAADFERHPRLADRRARTEGPPRRGHGAPARPADGHPAWGIRLVPEPAARVRRPAERGA